MSIVFDRIGTCGFARGLAGGSVAMFDSEALDDPRTNGGDRSTDSLSSSSTSSIGRNSDVEDRSSDDEESCKEDEAQSAYKGPLNMMESLEETLPIRRGISSFYNGKSKSFTSLAEASSASSIREIAKPENAYSRRQRNLMASSNLFWERSRSGPVLKGNIKRISKKPLNTSKSSLALAMTMSSSELSSGCTSEDSYSSQSPPRLPPLHPQSRGSSGIFTVSSPRKKDLSAWKSYSMVDLAQCNSVFMCDPKMRGDTNTADSKI